MILLKWVNPLPAAQSWVPQLCGNTFDPAIWAQWTYQLMIAAVAPTCRVWQQWEAGDRRMHPAFWELFNLKIGARLQTSGAVVAAAHAASAD